MQSEKINRRRKNRKMKKILKLFLTLILGLIIATTTMILVNFLPNERMKENLVRSSVVMEQEQDYHEVIPGMISSRLDNFTDSIMLTTSVHKADTGVIDRTMNAYRVIYDEKSPSQTLVSYAKEEEGYSVISYARYWHGYQIILKPMLLFFSYQEIRMLNMLLQMLIVAGVIVQLVKRELKLFIFPYLVMLLSLVPCSVMLSLQLSGVFGIMNAGVFVLLKWKDYFEEKKNYYLLFVIMGMVTSFVDLLTYPLITLGVPLTFYLVLYRENKFFEKIAGIIQYSICWAIGYGVMWCGKWMIGSILLKENIVKDAINALMNRTSAETATEQIAHWDVMEKNFETIFTTPIRMFFIGMIIICVGITFYKSMKERKNYFRNWHFIVVACMPFAWYFVTANHSYIHFWFTYRELAIFIFAILSWSAANVQQLDCGRDTMNTSGHSFIVE